MSNGRTVKPRSGNGLSIISVSVDKDLLDEVRKLAETEDRSVSNMICVLIKRGMKVRPQ